MRQVIKNIRIITNGEIIVNKAILINNGTIEGIVNISEIPSYIHEFDMEGAYICAGFIDLQIMGAGGALFGGIPSEDFLEKMEDELIRIGTVGFLPAVSTNSPDVVAKAIKSAVGFRKRSKGIFLGLHLEGPYLNAANRGAHPIEYIKKATVEEIENLFLTSHGEIKMMTIAPELQDKAVINLLNNKEVVIAIGHSGASYQQAIDFFQGKKKAVTHLFNGMPQIHHRNPGMIPAIFREKPYTSIVADGIHVSFEILRMSKDMLGENLYLISDAATATYAGIYQHTYRGDRYVTVSPVDGSEILSGSSLTMLDAVRNCVEHAGISLSEAINMATLYPSRVLGMEQERGIVKEGYPADLVIFDNKYNITQVFFKGQPIFNK